MTIEVIKPGKPQRNNWRGTCFQCGCEIVCSKEDLTFEDRPCAIPYVACPTEGCRTHIQVTTDTVTG
jgi:hypothetical protein